MKWNLFFYCQVLTLVFFACQKNNEKGSQKLKVVDEITFETDSLVPVNPGYMQFMETDSGSQLFLYNHFKKIYQFYSYPEGKLLKEVPLFLEGPNSVKPFSGGVLTTEDSVWLVNYAPQKIVLINLEGEVQLRRPIYNELFPISYIGVSQQTPLYQIGKKIFGAQPLFMKYHDMDKADIQKHQLVYSYDIIKDTVQWYDVFYREDYWDKGKKGSGYSWAKRADKIYIAGLYDHEIQVFDTKSGKVTSRKEVKSETVNKFLYVNEVAPNRRAALEWRIKYDQYGALIYDPFRDVLYRVTTPAVEYDPEASDEDLNNLNYYRPYTCIMVLDKELNVLAEHTFDSFEVYVGSNYFVREDGLYLSRNNLFHPDYDEGVFRYLVVRFEKE